MGRAKLPVGSYGEIGLYEMPGDRQGRELWRARVQYRGLNGKTRPVQRYGQSKTEAKRRLRVHLADVQAKDRAALITSDMTVAQLADAWRDIESPEWSTNTRERYDLELRNHVIPELGSLLVVELRRSIVSAALQRIMAQAGPAAAKSSKSVLSGMCKLAMIHDLLDFNPARDTIRIKSAPKEKVRAMTEDEVTDLSDKMQSDERALELDLVDLVEFMLGMGCRIGEACAGRLTSLSPDGLTWEINATAVRVGGARRRKTLEAKENRTWEEDEELQALRTLSPGMHIQERPKTAAGWRILALPQYVVEMIERRKGEERISSVVDTGLLFAAPGFKTVRDPSNTAKALREMLDRNGYPWVTSHIFRKTVATRLGDAGLPPKVVADVLGHARPSMTLDVYMGRTVVSADAARILNR